MAAAANARGAGEYVGEARVRQAVQASPQRGQFRIEIYRTVNLGEIRSSLPPHQAFNSNFILFMTRLGSSVNQ